MELVVVTGVWKRPEIFEIFANGIKALKIKGLNIRCVVAGSEGVKSKKNG